MSFDSLLSFIPMDPSALSALMQVIIIDIVLAGDNAIIIGMAAAQVPLAYRSKVIFWGLAAAVVLRIGLAMITATLLGIPGIMLFGGLLLVWVAWRMYKDLRSNHQNIDEALQSAQDASTALEGDRKTVRKAIIQIVIADISMSLDNVLAVAGAAMHHIEVLVIGLLLSIILMGAAATLVARLLHRYSWIGYVGLIVIIYVAATMIWDGAKPVLALLQAQS